MANSVPVLFQVNMHICPMYRTTNLLLSALALAFGVYVLIRAWNIPITVDECSTTYSHVPRSVLDLLFLQTDANPNNHILNTLLIKMFTGLFGWHPFVVRIPALLGALAYATMGLLLCRDLSKSGWVSVFAYVMLLGQPFMLEFFSLARGYALGMGCMVTAIWFGVRFLKTKSNVLLFWAIVFAGLTVYANFTQVLFFIPFWAGLFYEAWKTKESVSGFWKKTRAAWLMSAVWAALLFLPIKRVGAHSEVRNWERLDTFYESVKKSITSAISEDPLFGHSAAEFLSYFAILFTLGITYVAVRRWLANGKSISPDVRIFIPLLLGGVVCVNVLQVKATHTPYLQPRLALLYWPLFALSLGIAAAWLYERSAKWTWALIVPLSIVAVVNTSVSANLNKTLEWWHDKDTYTVLEFLRNLQQKEGHPDPYDFDTANLLINSFIFHIEQDPRDYKKIIQLADWHPDRPATKEHEFYYAKSEVDAAPIIDDYEVVLRFPSSCQLLLRKKKITPSN